MYGEKFRKQINVIIFTFSKSYNVVAKSFRVFKRRTSRKIQNTVFLFVIFLRTSPNDIVMPTFSIM